jgi:hypothetical protein
MHTTLRAVQPLPWEEHADPNRRSQTSSFKIRGPRRGGRCSEGLKFKSLELNLAWKVYVFDLIARIRRAVCNTVTVTVTGNLLNTKVLTLVS